ncbi:MAG: hypothetical protein JXR56_04090, partial [Candidatus Cloacimonetes bacterium]|nr:hypothetical protein [Candidatus Cloacimonadota bacterium]
NEEFKTVVFINKNKCNTTRIFREVLKGEVEIINTENLNTSCLRKNTLVIYIDFDKENIIKDDVLATIEESKADVILISTEVNKLDFDVNGFFFAPVNIPALLFPYIYTLVIKALTMVKVLKEEDRLLDKIIAGLINKAGAITRNQPFDLNLAKHYAHYIHGRIPLIYYTQKLYRPIAGRLKNQINRISKYPAFYSSYENMQMYEMGVWERELLNENYVPIIISRLSFTTPERDDFKDLLTKKGINFLDIYGENDNPLVDFACLVYFVDMIAFYLAMLGQNDPIET